MTTPIPPLKARPAIVDSYDPKTNKIVYRFTDMDTARRLTTFAPHPYAANGWGIFVGPTSQTRLMMTHAGMSQHVPIGTIPQSAYSNLDFGGTEDLSMIAVCERKYPSVNPGDIVLQSLAGSRVKLTQSGIELSNGGDTFIKHDAATRTSIEYFKNKYENTEAYRKVSGIILRDLRAKPRSIDSSYNKLLSIDYDSELSVIGRNPDMGFNKLTTKSSIASEALSFRNPALVENRTLTYEYALKDMVDGFDEEVKRLEADADRDFLTQASRRDMQRTDVLNLGMHAPNLLHETIVGTAVDIYGNILDINRNKILFSARGEPNSQSSSSDGVAASLKTNLALLRRSIKYHFELNSRKSTDTVPPPRLDSVTDSNATNGIGHSHSRFAIDIDGEGLMKINVPASSNTGNIPLLSRYVNSSRSDEVRNDGQFRDKNRIDLQHFSFGAGAGLALDPSYAPTDILSQSRFKYHTAYHDILNTVSEAQLSEIISPTLINSITDTAKSQNAGGRSVHANLDGSLEMNIGRDIADKKSIVIDTAGSIVSRIGMDKHSHSVLSQLDGNVYIQVGGDHIAEDEQNDSPVVKIFVKVKSADNDTAGYHTITLDSSGIHFESSQDTDIEIKSGGDLKLVAEGQTLLSGKSIALYGSDSGQMFVIPNGLEIE